MRITPVSDKMNVQITFKILAYIWEKPYFLELLAILTFKPFVKFKTHRIYDLLTEFLSNTTHYKPNFNFKTRILYQFSFISVRDRDYVTEDLPSLNVCRLKFSAPVVNPEDSCLCKWCILLTMNDIQTSPPQIFCALKY